MNNRAKEYLVNRAQESESTRRIRKQLQWKDLDSRFKMMGITEYFRVKRSDTEASDNVVVDIVIDDDCWVRYHYDHEIYTLEVRVGERSSVNIFETWARVCEEIVRQKGLTK